MLKEVIKAFFLIKKIQDKDKINEGRKRIPTKNKPLLPPTNKTMIKTENCKTPHKEKRETGREKLS